MTHELALYSLPGSFYSARCRAVANIKGVILRLLSPPGGVGSPEFKLISPLGKVPALATRKGVLIESQVICDYLEALYPSPPLYPEDPWERAQNEALCRYIDLYLAPLFTPIWRRIRREGIRRGLSDDERLCIGESFSEYERLLEANSAAPAPPISMCDCAIAPVVFLYRRLYRLLGESDPAGDCPVLARRFDRAAAAPGIAEVLSEMAAEAAKRQQETR